MKKILLVRMSSLGDIIFNIPLANVLKKNGFEVTWLVTEKGIDVIKDNPCVDNTIFVPLYKWQNRGFSFKNIIEYLKIIRQIRKENFDIAIDTQMMFKSFMFMPFCKAKRRIVRTDGVEGAQYGGNERFTIPFKDGEKNIVFKYLYYAKYLNLDGADEVKYTLPPSKKETVEKVDELLKNLDKSKPTVVIAPATTWRAKHWNKDNWIKVINSIKDKCSLVFTGNERDKELISYIGGDNFINLAGKTEIKDLIEIFSRAKLVIAPDSGSAHLARATEKPAVISIFCCTPSNLFGPFGNNEKYFSPKSSAKCSPCYMKKCPLEENQDVCTNTPEPDEIINIVNKVLQND